MELPGIGISLVDKTPKELVYITLDYIDLTYKNSSEAEKFELTVGKVQIDNQLRAAEFPIVLSPSHEWTNRFFSMSFEKSNLYKDIKFFRFVKLNN